MHQKLVAVIAESKIWSGAQKDSHAFLISPSAYQITKAQQQELVDLGFALYDCLLGLSHIAVIAYDQDLNYNGIWSTARKIFSSGVPKIYQSIQGMNVRDIPRLLKVDLMVDRDGNFKIVEIDGHNKHGIGYSTLGKRFRKALYPEANALPGVVNRIAWEVRSLGYEEFKLFYADRERFYLPEFEIAKQEFWKHGIKCHVVSEMKADETFVAGGLFLDLPFLNHRTDLYETIIPAYKNGNVRFIIPPKPFLGAKSVLAFLRNDNKDDQVEAILQSFIRKHSLDLVRRYIPETLLIGRRAEHLDSAKKMISQKRYVLKESISSGMKGTYFSDDPDFGTILARASSTNMNWILQEEVENRPQNFSWFENGEGDNSEIKMSNDWFMRVTVQYVNRQLADIAVTARRDKAVHGAKDCILLGTIIV